MLTITDQTLADFLWLLAGDLGTLKGELVETQSVHASSFECLDFVRGALYVLAYEANGEALVEHSLPSNAGSTPARSTNFTDSRTGEAITVTVTPRKKPLPERPCITDPHPDCKCLDFGYDTSECSVHNANRKAAP